MFDYVRCELPLPACDGFLFQTKDTASQRMMHHTITSVGRLILHDYQMEATPEGELPYRDAPKGSFLRLFGSIRKVEGSERDVDQEFDGDLIFYPDVQYEHDDHFRATFRSGTCQEVCHLTNGQWIRVWTTGVCK